MFTVFKTIKFEYNSFSNYYKLTIPICFHKRTITTFEIRFGNWRFVNWWGHQLSIILHTANRLLLFKKRTFVLMCCYNGSVIVGINNDFKKNSLVYFILFIKNNFVFFNII
jgi:hypothetical protein